MWFKQKNTISASKVLNCAMSTLLTSDVFSQMLALAGAEKSEDDDSIDLEEEVRLYAAYLAMNLIIVRLRQKANAPSADAAGEAAANATTAAFYETHPQHLIDPQKFAQRLNSYLHFQKVKDQTTEESLATRFALHVIGVNERTNPDNINQAELKAALQVGFQLQRMVSDIISRVVGSSELVL